MLFFEVNMWLCTFLTSTEKICVHRVVMPFTLSSEWSDITEWLACGYNLEVLYIMVPGLLPVPYNQCGNYVEEI